MKDLGLKTRALECVVMECVFAGPLFVEDIGNKGDGRGSGTER